MMRSRIAAMVIAVAALTGVPATAHAEIGSDLVGDPYAAAQYWGHQHYDDCALMSVADVVGQVTGNKPSEEEVIALAASTPSGRADRMIYTLPQDAGDGSVPRRLQLPYIRDLPTLLAHYNVNGVLTSDAIAQNGGLPTGIPGLESALRDGKKVIASLNGETIWDIPGNRTIHDHDVVVTGIDKAAGVVHLNDSYTAGPDSQVSVDVFDTAWSTSDHSMVVAG